MRDPARVKRILRKVYRIWRRKPDARLLQLLINGTRRDDTANSIAFFVEDDTLEARLDEILARSPVDALGDLTDDAESLFIEE